jgi:hypothetical protein
MNDDNDMVHCGTRLFKNLNGTFQILSTVYFLLHKINKIWVNEKNYNNIIIHMLHISNIIVRKMKSRNSVEMIYKLSSICMSIIKDLNPEVIPS